MGQADRELRKGAPGSGGKLSGHGKSLAKVSKWRTGVPPVFAPAYPRDRRGRPSLLPLIPPNRPIYAISGLENFREGETRKLQKRGWQREQDDLSWQAQNLGSGG